MGRVQLFEIRLSQGRVVYSPGEPLAGAVHLRLGAPLPFRAIRVTCMGSCGVSNKANDGAWVVEESYFNSSLSLADKGSLPPGEHNFPFQFLLPATAPTSFEGPFGKIVHQVRASIDTPRFSKDHKCSLVFYILSPLNLNSIPDIEQPNVASTTKKFSYKLVKTGSVVLTASTDLRGYVVGQVLRLQADIENQSGKDTSPVVASLLQKVSYKAKRWIYDVRTIAEVEGTGVKAWRHAQWQEQILVPALPQSALPGCSLIHIDYYLQVSMKAPEATVTLPLFVGNIAVNQTPLSPCPGPGSSPGLLSPVVPSAPPQEEAEAVASGPHFSDPVSLSTKSHSQQQPLSTTLGSVSVTTIEPCVQVGSPARHSLHPPLCISIGATVPYFAEGSGGPVPTTSALILPPEYSSWGYPYEAPPSYEQSCGAGGTDVGLIPGS
ncbi:arrestin domain containing 1, isoform CRA_a [Rattus norvegicus]|uniref:Arrestin domain-containing protein 1 n=1 Tax=Rattus norvegicus TaxID=10116 RepID=ARRD1_RAT|nr:arrestin domain-containing protein 1 [Rattus norvegicus]XP_032759044.1 arrestin domain-containing protein 1 isoform X1 [Rattus rattus]B0BNL6.1 RecName: Full=Arrestin domain-containing protein 1; AltName: Full=Alpha-arrestin 1 [Rattus norvegicus]AAI58872.1 Arrdc1 protein [Rattus norvegicus]EDL93653.1 arrestin domain containing 1, isoform CRA_a [Rattus norvegicus]|eukprot:NP_001094240.1 arrestin domain-containing protein 1 [Rattus norvegicus]